MDIITHLRNQYGETVLQGYRIYERRMCTLKRLSNQIQFLTDCIEEQVTPRTFGPIARPSFDGAPFPEYSRLYIQDQLLDAKNRKEVLLYDIRNHRRDLRFRLPDPVFNDAIARAGEVAHVRGVAHFSSIKQKLNNLCSNSRWEQFANPNNVIVIGDIIVNKYEKMLLSL